MQESKPTDVEEYKEITIDDLIAMGFEVTRTIKEAPQKAKGSKQGRTPISPTTLRRSQLRALAVLVECDATNGSSAITLSQMSKRSRVSEQTLKQGLGANEPLRRGAHDTLYGFLSLLTQGLVMVTDVGGEYQYYLSTLGQRKCDDLEDELVAIRKTRPNNGGLKNRTGPKVPKSDKKVYKKRPPKRIKHDSIVVKLGDEGTNFVDGEF